MNRLITKLQNEAGFTKEQARRAVEIFKDFVVENNEDPDFLEMLKIKSKRIANNMKTKYDDLSDKVEDWADRAEDRVEDWSDRVEDNVDKTVKKVKRKAKNAADKVSDYLDD